METLKNPVEVKAVVWGNALFIFAVMAVGVFLSPMAGAILFGVPIGIMYSRYRSVSVEARVFLGIDHNLSFQKTESLKLHGKLASRAAWVPVLGISLSQEKFSPLLLQLKERYESTYWKAYLEEASHEAMEGKVGDSLIQWLRGYSSEAEKRSSTLIILSEVERGYQEILKEWEEKIRKQKKVWEKEEEVVSSGNISDIRDFYRRYTPLPEGVYYRGLKRGVEARSILRCVQEAKGDIEAKCSLKRMVSLVQGIWDLILYQDAPVQFAKTMRLIFAPKKILRHIK